MTSRVRPDAGISKRGGREMVYRLARRSGLCRLLRRRDRAPVFCFHNVVAGDGEAGDRSLHIPIDDFRLYASWIAATYRVAPLGELVERLAAGRSVTGLAALTFDDAYVGTLRHALPVLAAEGIPSTVFVVSDASSAPKHFWWDLVAGPSFGDPERDRCVGELAGDRQACLEAFGGGGSALGEELLPSTWDALRAVEGPVDFGVHTVSHRNLARLGADAVAEELSACRNAIAERLGLQPTLVSYPYGGYSDAVASATRVLGFAGGVILENRQASAGDDPFMLPRVNVPAGISLAALECRAVDVHRLKPGR